MILQNVGKHSPNDTVPHPRSLGSSATLLWVPHISHAIVLFVNEIECTDTTFEDSFGTLLAVCVWPHLYSDSPALPVQCSWNSVGICDSTSSVVLVWHLQRSHHIRRAGQILKVMSAVTGQQDGLCYVLPSSVLAVGPLRLLPNTANINPIVKLTTHLDQVPRFTLRHSPILPHGIMVSSARFIPNAVFTLVLHCWR